MQKVAAEITDKRRRKAPLMPELKNMPVDADHHMSREESVH